MPSKHIKDESWKKIEKVTVKAVIQTMTSIKETEMLDYIIEKGLKALDEIDFDQIAKKKKK